MDWQSKVERGLLVLLTVSTFASITHLRSLQDKVDFLYQWNIVKKMRVDYLECKLLKKGCQPWMEGNRF